MVQLRAPAVLVAALVVAASTFADGVGRQDPVKPFDASRAEQKPFGIAGDPTKVTVSMGVAMSDSMRFTPDVLHVKVGENVRLMALNHGKTAHEVVLGTLEDLQRHAAMMRDHPGMAHDEPHMAHVEPGKTEWIVWTFNRPGDFYFGCLVPGHFEAGMLGRIIVR